MDICDEEKTWRPLCFVVGSTSFKEGYVKVRLVHGLATRAAMANNEPRWLGSLAMRPAARLKTANILKDFST
jgi:hypothetical protein